MFRGLLFSLIFVALAAPASAASHPGGLFSDLFGQSGLHSGTPSLRGDNITIVVDISEQEMKVMVDGRTVYTFDVSTGRPGYSTPTGTWKPYRMHEMWYSSKYENSPMPFSIFFLGGYAIHGTEDLGHLGTIASHGCVRLDPKNAEKLFALVKDKGAANTTITVQA